MKTQKTKGFYDRENDTVHIFIPPAPTESERGGITAKEKTTESLEVTIDSATGKAYVALDKTLSKTGEAADAAVVGEKLTSMGVAIENVKEDKADKTSLAQTDRKLDALLKLNQGISYEFQTDDAEAYQKTVPSGAKVASIKSIGGKTIVWNQLNLNNEQSITKNGISFINNKDGSWTINGTCSVSNDEGINTIVYLFASKYVSGHKYLVKADKYSDGNYGFAINGRTYPLKKAIIINYAFNPIIFVKDKVTVDNVTMRMNIFDLTQMFGAGNEPSTPEEFEAMFPADYYPYNAGELMSAPVNAVMEQGKNLLGGKAFADKIVELGGTLDEANGKVSIAASVVSDKTVFEFPDESKSYTIILSGENTNTNSQSTNLRTDKGACNRFVDRCSITTVTGAKKIFGAYDTQVAIYDYEKCGIFEGVLTADDFKPYHKTSYPIPQAILDLEGYGESGNFVDFVEKKYHKGDRTIDISDIMGDTFQQPLEVEVGGTLTFKNSNGNDYRIPVPSSEEYVISLAEVAK